VARVLTGVALVAAVLAAIRLAPLPLFWALLLGLTGLAVVELNRILEALGRPPWKLLSLLGTLATVTAFADPEPALAPVLMVCFVLVLVRTLFSGVSPQRGCDRIIGTLLPVVYLGLTLGHVGGLIAAAGGFDRERGEDLLIFAIVAVYVGDTCAYYGGRTFGRHPMAPSISPKKTWEGFASGVIGAVAASALGPLWFFQALPWAHALTLGALLGVAGVIGDLSESFFKRAAGVKDSGGLLPGHGGVLDRVDSLLLAAPVLYWYYRLVIA
jgi:phosphatidate cytidylyltransferase